MEYPLKYLAVISRGQKLTVRKNAGYYCVSDAQKDDLLHVDFELYPADDSVDKVYATSAADSTLLLPGCQPEYDLTNNIYHLRITFNTTTKEQVSPSSSCGSLYANGVYTIKMRSFASDGLISISDRLYTIRCVSRSETYTVGTVAVGSIDHITISSTLTATFKLVTAPDLKEIAYGKIGDKVRLKYSLTFTRAKENVDIIGARLTNLIVSPYDSYQPINRTIIDEKGCAVNHTKSVLEVSGPFETSSNGSSPFIAYSPEMELARFSTSGNLYFIVSVEYCYTVNCFKTMCRPRKKRETIRGHSTATVSEFYINIVTPNIETNIESQNECHSKTTFIVVITSLLVLILSEITAVVVVMKKLSDIKSKITPSLDVSFEKLPLCDVYYTNPVNGRHPQGFQNHINHIVL